MTERKKMEPIEIYSVDGNTRTLLPLVPPANLKSTDAIVRWIKKNAQVEGTYAVQRTIAKVELTMTPATIVTAKLV